MRPTLLVVGWLLSLGVLAGPPLGLELRGGPDAYSGAESFRVMAIGDNDSLPPLIAPNGHPFDRWYTTSNKVLLRWALPPSALRLPPSCRVFLSSSLGMSMYTPRTAAVADLEELGGDRPYSGWLAASVGVDAVVVAAPFALTGGDRGFTRFSVELFAGGLGPWSGAGWTQHHAHHFHLLLSGQAVPEPIGWGAIETAPSLSADVQLFVETTLFAGVLPSPGWMSFSAGRPSLFWTAGLDAMAGVTRGDLALHSRISAGWMGDPLGRTSGAFPLTGYLFLGGSLRGVGWNSTIDAPLIDGSRVATVERLVGEVALGAMVRVWRFELSVGPVYRSNEVASLAPALRSGQLIWQGALSYVQ